MASSKGKYQKLYEERYGKTSSSKAQTQLEKNQNTINNYSARLATEGVDPNEALDKRNALEKFLNLKQDQNVIFDVFELLNRPQQALFAGWKNAQEGGDFLEGAKQGITGNADTQFKDILMNTGYFGDEKGKLDLVDVLGFAGDVFLDPADIIPVAGFSKIDNALDAGEGFYKALKQGDSLSDIAFKGIGKGIKGAAKGTDNLIEKALAHADETKGVLNNAGDVVKLKYLKPDMKSGANLLPVAADGLQDITGVTGRLQLYKNAKNKISNAFNVSDAAKEAIRTRRSLDASADTARETSKLEIRKMEDKAKKFAEKTNGKYGDYNQLINDGYMLLNSTVNRVMDEDTVIKLAKSGDMPAYPEAIDHLNNVLKRDVSEDAIAQIKQKYGKKAFDITVDKGNKLKLGKGWDEIQLSNADEIVSELSSKQKRLKEIQDITNNETKLRKLQPYELGELEFEEDELLEQIKDLSNKKDNYVVHFNRRYTPEQEEYLNNLAQRYGNNVDGYRDFIDEIFGTAWKRQDSDIMSSVKDLDNFGENIFSNANNPYSVPLSKNQALVMSPEEVYSGRSTNRDILKPMKDGQVGTNAGTVFYTDDPFMATGYGGDTLATPDNLGTTGGVTYRGLLSKTPEENVLTIGPNGAIFDDPKLAERAWLPNDVNYDWQTVPYVDEDTYNTFSKITKGDFNKLQKIANASSSETDFFNKINQNKDLVDKLKSKYKIDVSTIDRPGYAAGDSISKNIDSDNLYSILQQSNLSYYKDNPKMVLEDMFKSNSRMTDEIAENIYKNQATGRGTTKYNTINFTGVKDSIMSSRMGDDVVTINPGVTGAQERRFKALANKTPNLDTDSVFDVAENAKPVIKGGVDKFNDFIDKSLTTNLGKKYDYLTNDNYVAANILTPEGKSIVDEFKQLSDKNINLGKGNSSLLNTRKYVGSPEETNNFIREYIDKIPDKELKDYPRLRAFKYNKDAKFMETDYIKALTNSYVDEKGLSNVASATQMVNQTLLDDQFKNFDSISKVQKQIENAYLTKGTVDDKTLKKYQELLDNSPIKPLTKFDSGVPVGFEKISSTDFEKFVQKYIKTNNQFGNTANSKELTKLLKSMAKNGNDIAINSDVLRVIGAASDPKNVNALNTVYNKYLNVFKKWKTASPTNFLNNMVGNSSNMILGGVSMADQARFAPQVIDIMQNGEKYHLQKLAGKNLDSAASKTADLWEQFRKMGFGNASLDLAELPQDVRDIISKQKKLKGAKDYITNGLPSMFGYLNQKGDVAARLTVMLKANESPSFLKKLGAKDAYDAISKIMFDPEMLTSTEKKIKQLIPFYTYTKNNLVYQITNMQNNGRKYNQLMKTMKSLRKSATNGNEDDMADYIKNSLYVPLPGMDKNGNYTVLRASLPFGQLIEMVDNPTQEIMSMTSPLIKGAYEQATGIDTFTGNKIESFPGQKSKNINLFGWSPSKRAEKALSDFSGLDVPLKNLSRLTGGDPLSTVRMQNNVDTDKLNRSYEQIEDLQNLMKQYEQKGYQFSTMSELKKANKNGTVANLDALFAKYGVTTDNKTYNTGNKYYDYYMNNR